jgi:hypothetical protein
MRFYEQYPMLRPYVGKNYFDTGKPLLLLIGESHYLKKGSNRDTTPHIWYEGNSLTLSEDEREGLNTREIFEESKESGFSQKEHSIWRNSLKVINDFGPAYSDFVRVAEDIAFYNFFLRPAFHGKSLKVVEEDRAIANEAFQLHIKELNPTAVIFLSRLAYDNFHRSESLSVRVIVTPHPGCKWWNKEARKYDNKKGRDLLADFIKKKTNWPSSQNAFTH